MRYVRFSELDGKSIALWGLGRETTAFRAQLERRLPSAEIAAVIDDNTPREYARSLLEGVDVLVRSPGVSIYKPLIQEALANGVTVTTATGLWLAERGGRRVIGVTGTKGKSTTATVIAHLLAGVTEVELAGNIGRPVIDLLDASPRHLGRARALQLPDSPTSRGPRGGRDHEPLQGAHRLARQ